MAADYKKLFIKYIDKIVFFAFLILFVTQVFKFVTTNTSTEGIHIPPIRNEDFGEEPTLSKERFVLKTFTDPLQLDARHDITSDPEKIEPGPNEKQCPRCGWISSRDVVICPKCKYSWTGVEPPPDNGGTEPPPPPPVKGIPFRVLAAGSKPVDILFFGYYKRRDGTFVLQINWLDNTRTSMVPEGDLFQGYRLFDLKEEDVEMRPPGMPAYMTSEYFVTIQKGEGKPVRVRRKQTVEEEVAMATLQASKGTWRVEHQGKTVSKGVKTFDVYAGDLLTNQEDLTITFEVLKVSDIEIILKDKDGKEHRVPASSR